MPAVVALAMLGCATAVTGAEGNGGDQARRPWLEQLSWKPRAYLWHNFLTHEECDHIVKISLPHIARSGVVNMDGSTSEDNSKPPSY